jgi:hypothetical protein
MTNDKAYRKFGEGILLLAKTVGICRGIPSFRIRLEMSLKFPFLSYLIVELEELTQLVHVSGLNLSEVLFGYF